MLDLATITATLARDRVAEQFAGPAAPTRPPGPAAPRRRPRPAGGRRPPRARAALRGADLTDRP